MTSENLNEQRWNRYSRISDGDTLDQGIEKEEQLFTSIDQLSPFLRELASDKPYPGGGSVSAFVASLAAACGCMVANLSDLNSKTLYQLLDRAYYFIERDIEVFEQVSLAWKLPKKTDEEKKFRREEIQKALIPATEVPLDIANTALDILENVRLQAASCSKNCISDCGVAALTAHAALESALLNVKINLKSIKDEEFYNRIFKEMKILQDSAKIYRDEIMDIVEKEIQ